MGRREGHPNMSDDDDRAIWVIYDHPPGHPNGFIAHKFLLLREGPATTDEMVAASTLEAVRRVLSIDGLECLTLDQVLAPTLESLKYEKVAAMFGRLRGANIVEFWLRTRRDQ
jgi:hypothetical protein